MTRENKLALVIGFGLMLFVGILVSDHFAAQRYDPATVVQDEIVAPEESVKLEAVGVEMLAAVPEPVAPGTVSLVEGGASAHPDAQPGDAVVAMGEPQPLAVEVAKADGTPVRFHKVQQGNNYWKIAKAEYGDGSLAQKLQEYNKAVAPDAAKLALGSELRIPPIDVLKPGAVAPVAGTQVAVQNPEPKAAARVAASYKIQKGDTPYAIAKRNGVKVADLLRHNGIKDPAALKPGQTLKIPAKF